MTDVRTDPVQVVQGLTRRYDPRHFPLIGALHLAERANDRFVWDWATQRLDIHIHERFAQTIVATLVSYYPGESPDYMPEACWDVLKALAESARRHCVGDRS